MAIVSGGGGCELRKKVRRVGAVPQRAAALCSAPAASLRTLRFRSIRLGFRGTAAHLEP